MTTRLVVLVLALLLSGCAYYVVPAHPKARYCWPAHSWKCSPMARWSDM